jgi:hypothetical protein
MAHTIEVLDAAIRGLPVETLTAPADAGAGRRTRRRLRREAAAS